MAKYYAVIFSTEPDLKKTDCVGELLFRFPELCDVIREGNTFVIDAEFYGGADVSVHLTPVYAPLIGPIVAV
ncbi:MAG: hypothetical protein M3O09_16010 [Acidobacteriota bacterium]|nr:hypothetical protein [Acidobacteriota bacterium]